MPRLFLLMMRNCDPMSRRGVDLGPVLVARQVLEVRLWMFQRTLFLEENASWMVTGGHVATWPAKEHVVRVSPCFR
jgi:hypothetical protein